MARKQKEANLKAEVKEYLTSIGAWWYMVVPTGYSRNGIPDFVVCYKGFFIGPETKKVGKDAAPWQKREIDAILAANGLAFKLDLIDDLKRIIAAVDEVLVASGRTTAWG